MKQSSTGSKPHAGRRTFLKNGVLAAGAATVGAGLLGNGVSAFGEEGSGRLTPGDTAILRFLAAAEIIETDLWQQYAELGGVQDSELPGLTGGSAPYIAALQVLDGDQPQYIHDNTEDEFTHERFINAYLASKGAATVNLDQFRTLPSSKATGAQQIGRLTNLMQLTVDTSWWTRYRSRTKNPDLNPIFQFPQAIPSLSVGEHTAIPRTDNDLNDPNFLQAIANTAGAAMGAVRALRADGLFIGQSQAFFNLLRDLAEEADEAGSEVRSRRRQMNFAVRVIGIKCEEIQPRPLRDAKWHGEGEVF